MSPLQPNKFIFENDILWRERKTKQEAKQELDVRPEEKSMSAKDKIRFGARIVDWWVIPILKLNH